MAAGVHEMEALHPRPQATPGNDKEGSGDVGEILYGKGIETMDPQRRETKADKRSIGSGRPKNEVKNHESVIPTLA